MNKEKIPTRKEEVRYTTSDPKKMLNKYLVTNLLRTWTEDFLDKDKGEVVSIERNETIFERGALINQDMLAKIRFYMEEGSITEVEVSNQKRMGIELAHTYPDLYKAKVIAGNKKQTFILYAQSVANVLEILQDYMELNTRGGFFIEEVKRHEGVQAVIVDNLATRKKANPELDRQFILGELSVEDYLNARVPDDEAEQEQEDISKRIFYQIAARIQFGAAESADGKRSVDAEERIEEFIVHSYTATRANMLIEKHVTDLQKKAAERHNEKHPDSPYLMRTITSFIEESKIFPVGCFIPLEFSMAYSR